MQIPAITFFHDLVPLGTFILLAAAGMYGGHLAKRIKLPDITGQILTGMLLGPGLLAIFSDKSLHELKIVSEVALGVLTFIAGTHLSLKKLHNASKRVFLFAGADIVISFLGVFVILTAFNIQNMSGRLLLAALAIATAPGTVVGLIQAKKARGVLVKTLLGVVALNNIAAIVTFEICKIIGVELLTSDIFAALHFFGLFAMRFVLDLLVGAVVGWLAAAVARHQHEEAGLFSTILLAILANMVICQYFDLSMMIVCMAAGVTFTNLSYHARRVSRIMEGFNGLILCVFFVLAGTHLHLSMVKLAGLAGVIYVLSRFGSKVLAVFVVGRFAQVPRNISRYLGMCLIPQSGLTIGLVLSMNEFDVFVETGLAASVAAIALAAVIINEIIGPLLTEKSFDLAKESGQSPSRLVDFLQEEFIMTHLDAEDKWDAIEKMCRFLVKTNHLRSIKFEELYQSVIDREKEFTTGLGHHLAVPHARIPASESLMGVVGILKKPVDFESLDGDTVDIICLVATPEGKENLHLKVLETISKIFMDNVSLHAELIAAKTPAEVYDLFQCVEVRKINYFLDDNE